LNRSHSAKSIAHSVKEKTFSIFTNRDREIMNLVDNLKLPIMVFVGLILAIYPIVSQADSSAAKPALVIESPRHDAGPHWEGEVVSHTFKVKNSGSEELRILSVKPG
jgi:hypothetical protein